MILYAEILSILSVNKGLIAFTGIADDTLGFFIVADILMGTAVTVGELTCHDEIGEYVTMGLQALCQAFYFLTLIQLLKDRDILLLRDPI